MSRRRAIRRARIGRPAANWISRSTCCSRPRLGRAASGSPDPAGGARQEHAFIRHGDIDRYCQAVHVSVPSRAFGAVLEDTPLESQQIERRTVLRCQNYLNAMGVARTSDLILAIPRQPWTESHRSMHGLETAAVPFELPDIARYAYWHAHHETDQRHAWRREIVADCVRSEVQPTQQ